MFLSFLSILKDIFVNIVILAGNYLQLGLEIHQPTFPYHLGLLIRDLMLFQCVFFCELKKEMIWNLQFQRVCP